MSPSDRFHLLHVVPPLPRPLGDYGTNGDRSSPEGDDQGISGTQDWVAVVASLSEPRLRPRSAVRSGAATPLSRLARGSKRRAAPGKPRAQSWWALGTTAGEPRLPVLRARRRRLPVPRAERSAPGHMDADTGLNARPPRRMHGRAGRTSPACRWPERPARRGRRRSGGTRRAPAGTGSRVRSRVRWGSGSRIPPID